MTNLTPINQTKLFGLGKFINELIRLYEDDNLPNKILLSGQKGQGKSTLAYHFVNYVLSKNEKFSYDLNSFEINHENQSFKTILNKSNINFHLLDINDEKKNIDINQIRELISNLNKSSFNDKPRFVLIDNIEFLNINSLNALLKILEEPSLNVFFILINNNKKILPTLLSRCINFKISLSNNENSEIIDKLLLDKHKNKINNDIINYYFTPGNIYNLIKFAEENNYDLKNMNLHVFLNTLIDNNHYKKDNRIRLFIYDLIEFYFTKLNTPTSKDIYEKYNYFMQRILNTKRFNLDEESLFIEFKHKILNG
tara:strand:+ start:1639 stop:2571 length:933 start_codon:yes stop_codon:yes gene_type:complete